jgi:hypothetical protein
MSSAAVRCPCFAQASGCTDSHASDGCVRFREQHKRGVDGRLAFCRKCIWAILCDCLFKCSQDAYLNELLAFDRYWLNQESYVFLLGTEIDFRTVDYACRGKTKGAIVNAEPCQCPGSEAGCENHPGVACSKRGQKGRHHRL